MYQATALEAMKDVLAKDKTPDEAWDVISARQKELLLGSDDSAVLLSSMVMQALGGPLEATNKFAKVNNEAATYDNLMEALEAKEALISILAKSGMTEFDDFDKKFCDPWNKQSANGFLLSDERVKLYKIFVNRSIRKSEDGKLTDEQYETVLEVKGLLGISDEQAEIEARASFGPLLQKVLHKATKEIVEDYTPELVSNMQKEIDEVMENYRLKDTFLRELGASFYAQAVALVNAKVSETKTSLISCASIDCGDLQLTSIFLRNSTINIRILLVSHRKSQARLLRRFKKCFMSHLKILTHLTWSTSAPSTERASWRQWDRQA